MKFLRFITGILVALCTFVTTVTLADDTELYLTDTSTATGKRPQVLIIFDNSYSMTTEEQNIPSGYCEVGDTSDACKKFETYYESYSGYVNDNAIYWSSSTIDNSSTSLVPDDANEGQRFNQSINNCTAAKEALANTGVFTGYVVQYVGHGSTYKWESLAEDNGLNKNDVIDCYEDIAAGNTDNGTYADGYPVDNKNMYSMSVSDDDIMTPGQAVTLYSNRYIVWYKWVTTTSDGQSSGETGTRLAAAKAAIKNALETMSIPIDAGLAVFNLNYPEEYKRDGGRIIYPITEMTDSNETTLKDMITNLTAETNTPLCETLYEAYQYFSGGPVTFGNDDSKVTGNDALADYVPNNPQSILSTGNYTSPFKKCSETAYVIYITDGAPTLDHAADSYIQSLTANASASGNYDPFNFTVDGTKETSYLPALAAYMYNNDMVTGVLDSNGVDQLQNVQLYTIGFSEDALDAAAVLEEAAYRGGNSRNTTTGISTGYYTANDSLQLQAALTSAFKSILAVDSSFTSPSIASNNFDKTQTYNSAYYAMFLPSKGPRWSGNLKKLKVTSSGVLVAPGGTTSAINSDGNIDDSICTFWNTCSGTPDGNTVTKGGVLPTLQSKLKDRKIYTDISGLSDLSSISTSDLYTLLGGTETTVDSDYVTNNIDWLYGVDVDDEDNDGDKTDARKDIMGDPLHSKPLAINFETQTVTKTDSSDGSTITTSVPKDVRIILGTNQGLVHVFKDTDGGSSDYSVGSVTESWAFIPSSLLQNIPTLRQNTPTGSHSVYGMDSSPVAFIESTSSSSASTSGTVTTTTVTTTNNKVWVYMGMRRGGASYYALDLSNPDAPKLGWEINSTTSGYEDMGQTWSEPVITEIPGHSDPVLIFGGGMDSTDGSGQAVYIADAFTGALIHSFTASGMDSVPNKVAVLDSNNDGITDRIYASDISGNVWRMDLPSETESDWSIFEFASVSDSSNAATSRKFFAEPVVAQTQFSNISSGSGGTVTYQTVPYDAVTLGTGDRTNPLGTTINDMYFMFQDRNVVTKSFNDISTSPLTISDLYNVTSSSPSTQSENITFGTKKGWYYDYSDAGEKTLSASLIYDGKVYFTSFVPPTNFTPDYDLGICGNPGEGRLYVFDLQKGINTYSQTYYDLGERIPDTPQIVVQKDENGVSQAYIIGVGKGECTNGTCTGTINLGSGLTTNRIYYHINENQ